MPSLPIIAKIGENGFDYIWSAILNELLVLYRTSSLVTNLIPQLVGQLQPIDGKRGEAGTSTAHTLEDQMD
jgi:hypothetical protein